jgi:hypothetical protein
MPPFNDMRTLFPYQDKLIQSEGAGALQISICIVPNSFKRIAAERRRN